MDALKRRNDLMVTAAFARTLARVGAELDDWEICDEAVLLELLSLADRAEDALSSQDRRGVSDGYGGYEDRDQD